MGFQEAVIPYDILNQNCPLELASGTSFAKNMIFLVRPKLILSLEPQLFYKSYKSLKSVASCLARGKFAHEDQ